MIALIFVFIVMLILSAYLSGAEMAFVSANKLKFREQADKGDAACKTIVKILEQPQIFLTTILISNNVCNIVATVIVTYVLDIRFGITNEWLIAGIMAPMLIVFCEMAPKDYGRLRAEQFLRGQAGILLMIETVFYWPSRLVMNFVNLFTGASIGSHKSIFVDEQEFRMLIEETTRSGVLGEHEKELVDTILDFERIRIDTVMIPLEKLAKIPFTGTVREIKDIARRTKSRMVLVYEEIPAIVVGMVYVFDVLFEEDESQGLKKFLRSPIFLQRNISIEKAFLSLQEKRQSYAVVTDATGDVIGAVPIERLVV